MKNFFLGLIPGIALFLISFAMFDKVHLSEMNKIYEQKHQIDSLNKRSEPWVSAYLHKNGSVDLSLSGYIKFYSDSLHNEVWYGGGQCSDSIFSLAIKDHSQYDKCFSKFIALTYKP